MPYNKISPATLALIDKLTVAEKSSAINDNVAKIHISELTSLPAFAYEKLRNIVDYKDEYLLRQNAIKRFLKRKFLLPQFNQNPASAAQALIRELILSRYLPNDQIPEAKIAASAAILTKYYSLFNRLAYRKLKQPRWREVILGLAAVECDHQLISPAERDAYTAYAYQLLQDRFILPDAVDSAAKDVQLILAIQRVLERADLDVNRYYLLVHYYPAWFDDDPHIAVSSLADRIDDVLNNFQQIIEARLGRRLLPRVRRLLVPLMILQNIVKVNLTTWRDVLTNSSRLEQETRLTYQEYWQNTRKKIRRKGFHAVLYIFITKMALALLVEIPYEYWVMGAIHYLSVIINLAVPPLLMVLITVLIKSPGQRNEAVIIQGVKELVGGEGDEFYRVQHLKKKPVGWFKKLAYGLLYIITISISFGGAIYLLWRLQFNLLSGAIFILFISLVSFFGISLRQQARQLKVVEDKETILAFLLDFFSLPVVALGKWLSQTFDKINIFVFMLDFLFEVPFKSLLKIIEDWFQFLKDKKEEMY